MTRRNAVRERVQRQKEITIFPTLKNVLAVVLTIATLLGSPCSAPAQVINDKKTLTLADAEKVIAAAKAEAKKNNEGGVIAVVDEGGNLMALERIDGSFAAGANISMGKARTAVLFQKPSKFFEDVVNKGRTAMVALNYFTPLQGGVPILVEGQVVGGVGVSGAASATQDEAVAMAGAAALTGAGSASGASGDPPASAVLYYAADQVSKAFEKGAVLYDGDSGQRNYMVHASHRDQPGMAEIHTQDTDIIYVLDGTTTFVTGGTAVDPKHIAADEIRGNSISGGEARTLHKGDVIIVPNGVPHWFKEIPGPFSYFVVKVR
jgi:glc operon protein GlcG